MLLPPTNPTINPTTGLTQLNPTQAFYNGFMPNFARLGSWNVAMFLMLEQV
jgi:hypothetical protein